LLRKTERKSRPSAYALSTEGTLDPSALTTDLPRLRPTRQPSDPCGLKRYTQTNTRPVGQTNSLCPTGHISLLPTTDAVERMVIMHMPKHILLPTPYVGHRSPCLLPHVSVITILSAVQCSCRRNRGELVACTPLLPSVLCRPRAQCKRAGTGTSSVTRRNKRPELGSGLRAPPLTDLLH